MQSEAEKLTQELESNENVVLILHKKVAAAEAQVGLHTKIIVSIKFFTNNLDNISLLLYWITSFPFPDYVYPRSKNIDVIEYHRISIIKKVKCLVHFQITDLTDLINLEKSQNEALRAKLRTQDDELENLQENKEQIEFTIQKCEKVCYSLFRILDCNSQLCGCLLIAKL